jgi:hypothetical protein
MQRSPAATASADRAWMLDLIFGGQPAVAWAAAGSLPPGYRRVEQFAALPAGPGRSFLVSLAARRGSASALTAYNALRPPRKRAVRSAIGLGLRSGIAQPLLRDKIDIGVRAGASHEELACDLLTEHLRQQLGSGPVVMVVGGGDGPYRKPVLQVFSIAGEPLSYVKVGWNDWTRAGVRREAAALLECAGRPMQLGVPRLLGLSSWHGLDLLMTAPMPRRVRRLSAASPLPAAASLLEISQLSRSYTEPLASSPWWRGVRSRIESTVTDLPARSLLEELAGQLELSYGRVPLDFGFCHGDLVPWNLARLGERLYAWDWESSAPDAPLGFDAVHFHFQLAFVGHGLPVGEAASLASRAAWPMLRELGVPTANCGLVATLHLVELFLRHEEARTAAGDADGRFYPAVADVLGQRLPRTRVRPLGTKATAPGRVA